MNTTGMVPRAMLTHGNQLRVGSSTQRPRRYRPAAALCVVAAAHPGAGRPAGRGDSPGGPRWGAPRGYHSTLCAGDGLPTASGGLLDPEDLLSQPLKQGARRVAPVFTCEQVMEPVTTCFKPDTPMREVIEEFLRAENVSGFPVCDENEKLVGLISLSDIMWHEAMQDIIEREKEALSPEAKKKCEDPTSVSADATFLQGNVKDSMTVHPTVATPAMLVSEAAAQMLAHQVTRLPVVATKGSKKGQVVGILTRQNIMRCIAAAWI